MSFWFEPSRTDTSEKDDPDLHPTDLSLGTEFDLESWMNGVGSLKSTLNWGTKDDLYCLTYLLGNSFTKYVNKWAPPNVVKDWGNRLFTMASHHMLADNERWLRYGKWLVALGQRGIGLVLSG